MLLQEKPAWKSLHAAHRSIHRAPLGSCQKTNGFCRDSLGFRQKTNRFRQIPNILSLPVHGAARRVDGARWIRPGLGEAAGKGQQGLTNRQVELRLLEQVLQALPLGGTPAPQQLLHRRGRGFLPQGAG